MHSQDEAEAPGMSDSRWSKQTDIVNICLIELPAPCNTKADRQQGENSRTALSAHWKQLDVLLCNL